MTFQPTAEVYVAAAKLCFRHQLSRRRFRWRMLVLVTSAAVAGALVAMIAGDSPLAAAVVGVAGAIGGLVFLIIIIFGTYLLLPRRSRRLFAQDQNIAQPTHFRWDDEGTAWESSAGSFRARWSDHHDWKIGREVILFFANDQLYRFVPTRTLHATQRAEIIARLEDASYPD